MDIKVLAEEGIYTIFLSIKMSKHSLENKWRHPRSRHENKDLLRTLLTVKVDLSPLKGTFIERVYNYSKCQVRKCRYWTKQLSVTQAFGGFQAYRGNIIYRANIQWIYYQDLNVHTVPAKCSIDIVQNSHKLPSVIMTPPHSTLAIAGVANICTSLTF